jgi:hypothetical protein
MTSRGSPSFLDRFIVHLAANLLSSQTVFDQLSNDDAPKPPPLYWRSSLLDDPRASLMEGASTEADNQQQLLFVDLTFEFLVKHSVPMLTVCFGCFLKRQQPTCLYVQGFPLTIMQLERHAQSVGIDLHSAPPKAMAGMMAIELKDILKSKQQTLPIKMEEAQLHLPLYYRDVEESGTLSMDIDQTTSQFDRLGMSLLFFSGSFNSQNSPENNNDDDEVPEQQLITKLEEWFQQQKQKTLEQDEQSLLKSTKTTVTTTKETVEPASNVSYVKNPRPTSQVHRYAQLPSKRRKKGKISYVKPTSR